MADEEANVAFRAEIAELKEKIERQRSGSSSGVNTLAIMVFIFCGFTVASVTAITLYIPSPGGEHLIVAILGFMTPTILALIGSAIQQNHMQMNSRLSELLDERGKSQFAKGKLEGTTEASNKN
jgi:hypothetical protein